MLLTQISTCNVRLPQTVVVTVAIGSLASGIPQTGAPVPSLKERRGQRVADRIVSYQIVSVESWSVAAVNQATKQTTKKPSRQTDEIDPL